MLGLHHPTPCATFLLFVLVMLSIYNSLGSRLFGLGLESTNLYLRVPKIERALYPLLKKGFRV